MDHKLEAPGDDADPEWDSLYRARGDEVSDHRPVFTGDVFFNVQIAGEASPNNVIILQHPCAIRIDGVTLMPKLLVGEVNSAAVLPPSEWSDGHYKQLPLAFLCPEAGVKNYAAFFTRHHLVTPDELLAGTRMACMSQKGVNLLMQRWVHHNSRAVIPTQQYQEVSAPQFEEADLTEDWCLDREDDGVAIEAAGGEIDAWLKGENEAGVSRRNRLKDVQERSQVRQELRAYLNEVRAEQAK